MKKQNISIKDYINKLEQIKILNFTLKWLFISLFVGFFSGSASALFLVLLDYATNWREDNIWIITFLPIAGFIVGSIYHYWGQSILKGNNLLLEEIHDPKNIIPIKMVPFILITTIITHFFGGSAGREGTAVQMGGSIADQFTKLFKLNKADRKILIITGISAGFASVFGTPLAGAIFGLEVFIIGKIYYEAILPSLFSAIIADYVCYYWKVGHTHYSISNVPHISPSYFIYAILAGILFGLFAKLFGALTHFIDLYFKKYIKYPPLRPFIGGVLICLSVLYIETTKYIGLGIPIIVSSFYESLPAYDFLAKTIFTSITLGSGFKGGEVTPLFYIGSTLGNALSYIIPLPLSLLAGMGFVGVFAGASNTPIACILMGIELFGGESSIFLAISCITSYLFSGHSGIYKSQIIGSSKHHQLDNHKDKKLSSLNEYK